MRRRKYDIEAIRAASKVERPHCHTILAPADYLRLDFERLRCQKCGNDFVYQGNSRLPMRTS